MSFVQAGSLLHLFIIAYQDLYYPFVSPRIPRMEHDSKVKTPYSKIGEPYSQPCFPTSVSDTAVHNEKKNEKTLSDKNGKRLKNQAPIRFNDNMKAQLLHDIEMVGEF